MNNGDQFGALTAVGASDPVKGHSTWMFRCTCGTVRRLRVSAVKSGNNTSCGCRAGRPVKHGAGTDTLYQTWYQMMQRCYNAKNKSYQDYGERGITVCQEWHNPSVFISDMGPRPEGTTLERKDNLLGYSATNCKWATAKEQQLNTRRTKLHTLNGVTDSESGWAKRLGMQQGTLSKRLRKGIPFNEAIKSGN